MLKQKVAAACPLIETTGKQRDARDHVMMRIENKNVREP
jgi:hypothetical protein